jgi:TonB family protein
MVAVSANDLCVSNLPPIFERRTDDVRPRLVSALVASVGLHALFVGLVWVASTLGWLTSDPPRKPPVTEHVDLATVSASDWERNRQLTQLPHESEHERERKREPPKPTPLPKGQIVDVAEGNDQKPADDAKYLAEHNNKVEHETRAREQTAFYGRAMPKLSALKPPAAKNTDSTPHPEGKTGAGTEEHEQNSPQPERREIPDVHPQRQQLAMLTPKPDGDVRVPAEAKQQQGNAEQFKIQPSAAGDAAPQPAATRTATTAPLNLTPSVGQLAQAIGAAPNDDLSGVDVSDSTFLNTREFKYAGFFNRVKQRVSEQWNPNSVLHQHDPTGRMLGRGRVTVVSVTIDRSGSLLNVQVVNGSGADFLDEEAMAAFERAAPFLNPPEGLLDPQGMISFRFSFHVDNDITSPSPFPSRRR